MKLVQYIIRSIGELCLLWLLNNCLSSHVFLFNCIALHHAHVHAVVTLCMSCLSFLMDCLLHFHVFMYHHFCISFRYARCTTCGYEARDDRTEPQDSVWWTHLEARRMVPDVHDQKKTLVKRVSSN